MVSCSVNGCSNASKAKLRKPGVTFHSFPLNLERRARWIQAIGRNNWVPSSHARVCSIHFIEEDLDRTSLSCVRVREHAVPSISLEFTSKKVPGAAPLNIEDSSVSMMSERDPSTSRDTIDEVSPMEVDEPKALEVTPPKYRNLLSEKEEIINVKDKTIARCNERLASIDRCISRIWQTSYRTEKRVAKLKNVIKALNERV